MDISYHIMNPSGNITALIDSPVPEKYYNAVAAAVTELHPETEQTGFVFRDGGGYRLNMAGGEFCGNATLSAAAYFAGGEGLAAGESRELFIKVSGERDPVRVHITHLENGVYEGRAFMPPCRDFAVKEYEIDGRSFSLPTVDFGGITHIIFDGSPSEIPAEDAVRKWCADLGAMCLGIMFLSPGKDALTPLVYSPGAGTLWWESSCASGTAAAGVCLARRCGGEVDISFKEPGGVLRIRADCVNPPELTGRVFLEKSGNTAITI